MVSAKGVSVYAFFIGVSMLSQSSTGFAKGEGAKEGKSVAATAAPAAAPANATEFQWHEHSKLTWDDFKGPVTAEDDESAAATHCGMGFKTITREDGTPEIVVYNKFYVNKSWVRSDAKIQDILDHEQGHFDLCELYTRKLRERMNNFSFNTRDVRKALYQIYFEVNSEYERRQQAYEDETTHGINTAAQKRWERNISRELEQAAMAAL